MNIDQIIKECNAKPLERTLSFEKALINTETRTVPLAFASEVPYERWFGFEILDCQPSSVDLKRLRDGGALLVQHNPDEHVGVVEDCSVDPDKVCRANVRFSKSDDAEEIFLDVVDGIRRKVSVGYMVHAMILEKEEEGKQYYRVTKWEPYEVSIVSIPADVSVGVGRSAEQISEESKPSNSATDIGAGDEPKPTTTINKEVRMDPNPNPSAPSEEAKRLEAERVSEIEAIGEKFAGRIEGGQTKMNQIVKDAVTLLVPAELFRGDIYRRVVDDKPLETPLTYLGLSDKEMKRYKFRNVILAQLPDIGKMRDVHGNPIDCSFEREVSDEISKRIGPGQHGGLHVPFDIQTRTTGLMDVTTSTQGGNLVGTSLLGGSFIDYLRNKMVALQLGVQEMSGLVGNIAIPRQTGDPTFYYVAENSGTTTSNATIGQLTMTPKTGGGFTNITRKLLLQSTPSADSIAMQSLAKVCRLAIDKAVFEGAGTSEPTGILNTSSVGSVTGANFGWDQAVEFESDVAGANADVNTMAYVMSAATRGILKTRARVAGYPDYLVSQDNKMNGYPVVVTNQVTANYVYFGDFSQAILGYWGTLDLLVDPFTASTTGTIRVTAFVSFDVGVIHAGSFSVCSDLT